MIPLLKKWIKLLPIPLSKNHLYDIQTKKIIQRSLRSDSNCIDVGCYKGEILDLIITAAPKGKYWGFEPIPYLYDALKLKYAGNSKVSILNYAVSNTTGVSTFNFVESNPSYSGLKKRDYDRPHEKDRQIEVRTDLLDNLISPGIQIDLIKIDVEGAELLVLEGAQKIVSMFRPLIIFEHGLGGSNHYNSSPVKVFDYFSSKGMVISTLKQFIKNQDSLSIENFNDQYYNRKNYYFIAHTPA